MKLVLIRHGQSAWNLENKFTGWTDVDLTEKGVEEAKNGGKTLKDLGLEFDVAFTSYQKRKLKGDTYYMKLVLIRHGQSAWNLENKFTGWTDVDLTEKES